MKKCRKCGETKLEKEYHKDSHTKSGISFICKTCNRKKVLEYKRTKKGLIYTIYSTQKATSKKRKYSPPNYTKQQLYKWMITQDVFHTLFEEWVKSGYKKQLIPSCDRISDYDVYKLSNIQIMTWEENNKKHYIDILNGKNTKHTKEIIVEDKITKKIFSYYSISEASRQLGINRTIISNILNNKKTNRTNYNFKLKFNRYE